MCELGSFITNGTDAPFYVRRVLDIEKNILKATAKVCGLGQFEFHINGQKVGDHELDPGWTDYRKYVEYVTFDVTGYLRQGKNAVGAEIGNGWYIMNREHYSFDFPAFMPPNPNPYRPFGKQLVFAMRLELLYVDGTAEVFTAGEGFRTAPHPVLQSNVYGSETIDAARFRPGWDTVGFDDSDWSDALVAEDAPVASLVEQFQPPVKVIRRYAPTLLGTVNGREIYDIGQNISGVLELCLRGRKGDAVRVYPAEKLGPDGDVDQVMKDWTTLDAVITFILGEDDVWQRFRMKFTYFAGRVLAVERSRPGIELSDMRADAISSTWKASGSFRCDDERYQKVYDMIERTVEANMLSVHTDCPTIERFAWQEPNHL
ncbi:MAG: family 78 glycoside hydrolase catalytic domain, partial [Blautia sp.]|nr:family 78 glycoside hydrolase catalytic domain [Blautia sp.]